MGWLAKYSLTGEELVKHHVFYSPSRRQLIFGFFNEQYQPTLWQARNFSAGPKYVTRGSRDSVLAMYEGVADCQVCTITEDCVSAIRTARHTGASVPCLGSSLSLSKITRLRAHFGPSWRFLVWLDSDMYNKAQNIATRFRLLGSSAMVLWTPEDPKMYNDKEMLDRMLNV